MKPGDKKLLRAVLSKAPHVILAAALQVFGIILLSFVVAIAFPQQKWVITEMGYWCSYSSVSLLVSMAFV